MLKDIFKSKPKYVTINPKSDKQRDELVEKINKKDIPDGLWVKCPECNQIIYHKDLEKNFKVCGKCNYHFRIGALERINQLVDENSFKELFNNISSKNVLNFPEYDKRLSKAQHNTGLKDAVITGTGKIEGEACVIIIMDFFFMGGSMGSVVGEKIASAFEYAAENEMSVIGFSAAGGARMQEGILSLMQMAKTCQALNRLSEKKCLFISILTDPTTGGVYASFASQGDIIIAEPKALIGFAGARVIEQTIRQTLPPGFQRSEFLLEHGFIDMIVERKELRQTLAKLLRFHLKK